jgi:Protein of unknown function (DUF3187)
MSQLLSRKITLPRALLCLIALVTTKAAASTPALPMHDENPLLAGVGLPMPFATRLPSVGDMEFSAAFNWGSSALVDRNARETLIVDAETRELRLQGAWGMTDRLALHWQIPYRYTGAGSLDSFIDSWHDFFGLPEGDRNVLPEDRFRIAYERDGIVRIDSTTSVEGLGDVVLGALYALRATDRTYATTGIQIELPTGDADDFNGSGALDIAALMALEHRLDDRWTTYAQAAVSWLGKGDLLPDQQESVVWSAMAGISFDAASRVRLNVQFDAHTGAYSDSDIEYLGEALILTLGGSIRLKSWQLDLGVSEDILVDASPDVVFMLGVSSTTRR